MKLQNIEQAIVTYYSEIEIGTDTIMALFNCSQSGANTLKKKARKVQAEDGVPVFDPHLVNTYTAFKAWGLDINDLERRFKKLQNIKKLKGETE